MHGFGERIENHWESALGSIFMGFLEVRGTSKDS